MTDHMSWDMLRMVAATNLLHSAAILSVDIATRPRSSFVGACAYRPSLEIGPISTQASPDQGSSLLIRNGRPYDQTVFHFHPCAETQPRDIWGAHLEGNQTQTSINRVREEGEEREKESGGGWCSGAHTVSFFSSGRQKFGQQHGFWEWGILLRGRR